MDAFTNLDTEVLIAVLTVIVALHPDTPANIRRARLAWRLWRDPVLHYSMRAAWILSEGR